MVDELAEIELRQIVGAVFETPAPSVELPGIVRNRGDADDKRFTDLTQAVEAVVVTTLNFISFYELT